MNLIDMTFRNPILRQLLRRSSVYTLRNLFVAILVVVSLDACWLRASMAWRESARVASLPPEFALREGDNNGLERFGPWYIGPGGTDAEIYAALTQHAALTVMLAVVLFAACVSILRAHRGYRGLHPWNEDIRLTRASPSQAWVALVDWPFLAVSMVLAGMALLLLIPARQIGTAERLMGVWKLPDDLRLAWAIAVLWGLMFGAMRCVQSVLITGWRFWTDPMLRWGALMLLIGQSIYLMVLRLHWHDIIPKPGFTSLGSLAGTLELTFLSLAMIVISITQTSRLARGPAPP